MSSATTSDPIRTVAIPKEASRLAENRFEELEWPTPQEEEWRRTDVTKLRFDEYRPYDFGAAGERAGAGASAPSIERAAVFSFSGGRLVATPPAGDLPEGVEVALLSPRGPVSTDGLARLAERAASVIDNRIAAWHYSSAMHGLFVHVHRNAQVDQPFVVEYLEIGDGVLAHPQLYLLVEEGASITLVRRVRTGDDSLLSNAGIDADIADNASVDLVSIGDFGPLTTFFGHESVSLGRDAGLSHFETFVGGRLVKNRLDVAAAGTGVDAALNGAYLGTGNEHFDLKTVQRHRARHASSRSYYKGAVRDSARTVFQGLIDVDHEAVQTDAYLTNNNLVLNDGARADSIPSLKIRTNDVKCSHGSTTGRVDEEELFYLQSRGFPYEEARRAIIEGYFEDVIRLAPEAVRDMLTATVTRRLESMESGSGRTDGKGSS